MPSSATITAFYNFTANTKARASHVQNNFDVFRGHLLPISPSTATSADNSYDLGSSNYRWRNSYIVNNISNNVVFSTASGGWSISDATTTSDYLQFSQNGSIKYAIGKSSAATTTAAVGQLAQSNLIVASVITTNSYIANATCTISTIGRPTRVGLCCFQQDSTSTGNTIVVGSASGATTTSSVNICIRRNGTFIGEYRVQSHVGLAGSGPRLALPPSIISTIDFPAAGSNKYELYVRPDSSDSFISFHYLRLYAIEE